MLGSFKGFFANQGLGLDFSEVSSWAKRRGHTFKRARDVEGFAIDGTFDAKSWRLEWGPPQRTYIVGNELRARADLGLPADLQMLLLSRPLRDALESQTYAQFTQTNQTEMGDFTPEEMRWLVMFAKIDLRTLKSVRARFSGVSSLPGDGLAWVEGGLANQLVKASRRMLLNEPPFVLMTLRGRAYLRMQLATADADDIAEALDLFETAASEALRVAAKRPEPSPDWEPSASTAWQSLHPGQRGDPKAGG
jgi:hypothetical protein